MENKFNAKTLILLIDFHYIPWNVCRVILQYSLDVRLKHSIPYDRLLNKVFVSVFYVIHTVPHMICQSQLKLESIVFIQLIYPKIYPAYYSNSHTIFELIMNWMQFKNFIFNLNQG